MKNRKFIMSTITTVLTVTLCAGMIALAAGYGSQEDPLVTLSYINDVALPQANSKIDSVIATEKANITSDINTKMTKLRSDLDKKIENNSGLSDADMQKIIDAVSAKVSQSADSGAKWAQVSLKSGNTLVCDEGSDFILRSGSATCYAPAASGIINLSNGETLLVGKAIVLNNLYNAPGASRGVTAKEDVTILVRGGYTVK